MRERAVLDSVPNYFAHIKGSRRFIRFSHFAVYSIAVPPPSWRSRGNTAPIARLRALLRPSAVSWRDACPPKLPTAYIAQFASPPQTRVNGLFHARTTVKTHGYFPVKACKNLTVIWRRMQQFSKLLHYRLNGRYLAATASSASKLSTQSANGTGRARKPVASSARWRRSKPSSGSTGSVPQTPCAL